MKLYCSAYPTVNATSDSMTIFLVNRHTTDTKDIQIDFHNFAVKDEPVQLYTLSELPSNETFVSHTENALKVKSMDLTDILGSVQLEPLSVNALVLRGELTLATEILPVQTGLEIFPNPSNGMLGVRFNLEHPGQVQIDLYHGNGQKLATLSHVQSFAGINHFEANLSEYPSGFYWITVRSDQWIETRKFILNK